MQEKAGKELRREFQEFYMISSLPSMRLGLFITLLLFIGFTIINLLFFPDYPEQAYYSRFGIVSPVIILSIMVTYFRPLRKWLHHIFVALNVLMCVAVFMVGITSEVSQKGSEYYYAWVMLVVIGLFVFYRMPFLSIVLLGLFQVLAFAVANVLNGYLEERPFFYFNNLFFVVAIYSVGFMLAFMYRRLNWKNFLHQKALAKNNLLLQEEINERKHAVEAYQHSEVQYHNTLDSIPDWIYVVDHKLCIVIINSSLKEGHRSYNLPVDVNGKYIRDVYPFMSDRTVDELRYVFDTGIMLVTEEKMQFREREVFTEIRKVPVYQDHKVIQVMTILRDRSKEREVEELKQRNTEQKEIMLREIHHRVKNNLAIVISLLTLQLRNNSDPELKKIIRDIEMRIRSMALIHEHLYRSDNLDRIPLATYIHALANIITSAFSGHRIKLDMSLEPTDVTIETALPLGLIVNELLTNAFKYAFPGNAEGTISIYLQQKGDSEFQLDISDNGTGLPENFSMDSQKSLGMFIVRLLVEQLDGKLTVSGKGGTSFHILFRNLQIKKQEIPLN